MANKVLTYDEMKKATKVVTKGILKENGTKAMEHIAIVAEPRGGIAFALEIAHLLGIKKLFVRQPGVEKAIEACCPQVIIWIDDIFESGNTYREAKNHLETIGSQLRYPFGLLVIPCVWVMKLSEFDFDRVAKKFLKAGRVDPHDWIVFPWEVEEKAEQDKEQYYDQNK